MLLGHNDAYTQDKVMRVTIVFNRFGAGLIERMPRWEMEWWSISDFQSAPISDNNIIIILKLIKQVNYCRVRFGYAHVANNKYEEWQMYAIGGSASPTILSEGNYFIAPNKAFAKQVPKWTKCSFLFFSFFGLDEWEIFTQEKTKYKHTRPTLYIS